MTWQARVQARNLLVSRMNYETCNNKRNNVIILVSTGLFIPSKNCRFPWRMLRCWYFISSFHEYQSTKKFDYSIKYIQIQSVNEDPEWSLTYNLALGHLENSKFNCCFNYSNTFEQLIRSIKIISGVIILSQFGFRFNHSLNSTRLVSYRFLSIILSFVHYDVAYIQHIVKLYKDIF